MFPSQTFPNLSVTLTKRTKDRPNDCNIIQHCWMVLHSVEWGGQTNVTSRFDETLGLKGLGPRSFYPINHLGMCSAIGYHRFDYFGPKLGKVCALWFWNGYGCLEKKLSFLLFWIRSEECSFINIGKLKPFSSSFTPSTVWGWSEKGIDLVWNSVGKITYFGHPNFSPGGHATQGKP